MSAPAFAPKGELVLTRSFDAPRELVFKVWTDPKQIPLWWGPHGFTTTVVAMDVRPGGAWRFTMRGPDGNDYPFNGEFVEIAAPERIVFVGAIHAIQGHDVWTEVRFTELDGKTQVRVHQVYAFEGDATRGAPLGWSQQLDRLEKYLVAL
jgi:uncharacterized protein YndB with AHSA1/START domain